MSSPHHVPADLEAMIAGQNRTINRMRKALTNIHTRLRSDAPLIDSHALSLIVVECETGYPELAIPTFEIKIEGLA